MLVKCVCCFIMVCCIAITAGRNRSCQRECVSPRLLESSPGDHCNIAQHLQDPSRGVEAAVRDPRRLMYGQSTAWPLLHMPSPHASSHGAASVALGDSFKVPFLPAFVLMLDCGMR